MVTISHQQNLSDTILADTPRDVFLHVFGVHVLPQMAANPFRMEIETINQQNLENTFKLLW